jgi:nitrite reductase/ring-hydroxylating ferredoxin subunit
LEAAVAEATESKKMMSEWGERLTPIPQGVGGFDECWYPIALSAEVPPGKVHGTEFLDGRVIVVRSLTGEAAVFSAYCRHYGADLSTGDMENGCVRCPYHHWKYDMSGQCVGNDVGDRVPNDSKLFGFPTKEKWGLIWAFNGTEPSYDVPSWQEDESERHFVSHFIAEYRGDPFLVPLNVIDTQHLRSLHSLDVSDVDLVADGNSFHVDMTISGDYIGLPKTTRHAQIIATNCVVYSKATIGIDTLGVATPVGGGRSRMYIATAGLRSAVPANEIVERVDARARASRDIVLQDIPIMDRMRFRVDRITKSDRGIVEFLRFAVGFPRSHPSHQFIT